MTVASCSTISDEQEKVEFNRSEDIAPSHFVPGTYSFSKYGALRKTELARMYGKDEYFVLNALGLDLCCYGQNKSLSLCENIEDIMVDKGVPYYRSNYDFPSYEYGPMHYTFLPGVVRNLKICPMSDLQFDITDKFVVVGNMNWYCWQEEKENSPMPVYSCETKSASLAPAGISIREYLSYSPMATAEIILKSAEGKIEDLPYGDLTIYYTVGDYTYRAFCVNPLSD